MAITMKLINIKFVYILLILLAFFVLIGSTSEKSIIKTLEKSGWKAPPEADNLKNPLKDLEAATEEGEIIFNQHCAICHGENGSGDGIAGIGLNPRPADLTSEEVQKQSDGAIFWKITTGKPPMASYELIYSEKQRWQLVTYIRKLGQN